MLYHPFFLNCKARERKDVGYFSTAHISILDMTEVSIPFSILSSHSLYHSHLHLSRPDLRVARILLHQVCCLFEVFSRAVQAYRFVVGTGRKIDRVLARMYRDPGHIIP